MKPNILFFSRSGYHKFFGKLVSAHYNSLHAVINLQEKKMAEDMGLKVVGCFEEMYESLPVEDIPPFFLQNGYYPDRFLGWLNANERQEILGKTIAFWRKLIRDHQVDVCVHETVSYEPEEVLTLVAKQEKIRDLNFLSSPINDHFFWKPDPYNSSFPAEMLENVQPSQKAKELAEKQINQVLSRTFRPDYMDFTDETHSTQDKKKVLSRLLAHLRTYHFKALYPFFPMWGINLYRKIRGFKLPPPPLSRAERKHKSLFYFNDYVQKDSNFYDDLIDAWYISQGTYDNLKDYESFEKIVYPLHYEPEATLLYFAPKFSDQVDTIQRIAQNIPLNSVLVVKEHPAQKRYLLSQKFQRLKRKNSNVVYLPAEIPSFELITNAQAVITITGTLGWEALVMEKPVFLLGNTFYDKHPQVTKLDYIENLRHFLMQDFKTPNPKDTFDYLCKVMSYVHEGTYFGKNRDTDENTQKVIKSIEKELNIGI